jgi:hypothetical protein
MRYRPTRALVLDVAAFGKEMPLPNPHPRPWHRGSVFGPGLRRPLCRERRAQWRAKLLLGGRPGGLTLGAVAVGRVLLDLLGQDGRLKPAIDTLPAHPQASVGATYEAPADSSPSTMI